MSVVFVTGGGGFIGRAVARRLRARGDVVRALVRDPGRATALQALGCELVAGDLADVARLTEQMRGADAMVHLAGVYRVGIAAAERPAMFAANVEGTRNALDAALAAGVPRSVYVSTINAFGDTRGQVVDESYRRPMPYRYVSYYDETKHLGHLAAEERAAAGAPILIVQPGGVYGPDDPSQLGAQLRQAMAGRLASVSFPSAGLNMVHVDDVAAGISLVLDRGRIGESYVLGGEITRLRRLVELAALVGGHRPPPLTTPTWLLRTLAPVASLLGSAGGLVPNLRELIDASDGVTYWATDRKARAELGFAPRTLDEGLAQMRAAILEAGPRSSVD